MKQSFGPTRNISAPYGQSGYLYPGYSQGMVGCFCNGKQPLVVRFGYPSQNGNAYLGFPDYQPGYDRGVVGIHKIK